MLATLVNAIAPLVVMMALGGLLKRWMIKDDGIWAGVESIVYYLLMPALLFSSIARADLGDLPWLALVSSLYVPIVIMGALALIPLWLGSARLAPATRTSLFQGVTRFNLYVSLGLGVSLLDPQQMALLGILAGGIVVFVNLLCVAVMVTLTSGRLQPRRLLTELGQNPLLLACLAGAMGSAIDIQLPDFGWITLERLAQTALPLSLLSIGAGLSLNKFSRDLGLNLYAGTGQLLLKPMLAGACVLGFGLDPMFGVIILLLMATPTAPSSYILARKLGGDASAMASIVVFQTVVGFGSLLLVLSLWQVVTGIRLTAG